MIRRKPRSSPTVGSGALLLAWADGDVEPQSLANDLADQVHTRVNLLSRTRIRNRTVVVSSASATASLSAMKVAVVLVSSLRRWVARTPAGPVAAAWWPGPSSGGVRGPGDGDLSATPSDMVDVHSRRTQWPTSATRIAGAPAAWRPMIRTTGRTAARAVAIPTPARLHWPPGQAPQGLGVIHPGHPLPGRAVVLDGASRWLPPTGGCSHRRRTPSQDPSLGAFFDGSTSGVAVGLGRPSPSRIDSRRAAPSASMEARSTWSMRTSTEVDCSSASPRARA
jgi:hypothetical protein